VWYEVMGNAVKLACMMFGTSFYKHRCTGTVPGSHSMQSDKAETSALNKKKLAHGWTLWGLTASFNFCDGPDHDMKDCDV
jgi:hypothetical protein